MSKHAPRGPLKAKSDPLSQANPLTLPSGIGRGELCTAHSKRTGKPCTQPAIRGGSVCRMHGGSAPQVKAAATWRYLEAYRHLQPRAVQVTAELLESTEYPTVRLGAVREINRVEADYLDRTEGRAVDSVKIAGADGGALEIVVRTPWDNPEKP